MNLSPQELAAMTRRLKGEPVGCLGDSLEQAAARNGLETIALIDGVLLARAGSGAVYGLHEVLGAAYAVRLLTM